MKHDIDWYCDRAGELIGRDEELRKVQNAMDRMARLEYNLPPSLQNLEWMRTVKTTAPADAIDAGIKVLSGLDERLRIDPVSVLKALDKGVSPDSDAAKMKANEWECAAKWQMDLASRRRGVFRDDIIRSALMYDEVVGQVIHLPSQIKSIEAMGGNANRYKAAMRHGLFAMLLRNPQTVHVRYSDLMAEAVLSAVIMEAQAIVDFWGDKASKIAKDIKSEELARDESLILFDYSDFDSRCVWACPGDNENAVDYDEKYVIMEPEENKLPFLPWVSVIGGTNLASAQEDQRMPLLYKVYRAESWLSANIAGSLAMSQSIATAAQPQLLVQSANPQAVEIDYTTPGGRLDAGLADKIDQLTQQPLNPALREAYDRFISDMARSTVPSVLISAETQPGEAFSGYNLRIQQAIGSLMRYKKLGERFYEGLYRQMLYWCAESGENISGYGDNKYYEIDSEDIDPDSLYLSVELTADVPLDRLQKINSAVMMSRELKYPATKILEELGETDPEKAMDDWAKEQFYLSEVTGRARLIQAGYELQIQEAQLGLQMQAQQAAMQAQAAQTGQPEQQPMAGGPMGMEGIEDMGPGMNPEMMGTAPAQAGPEMATFEGQMGRSRGGEMMA